MEQPTPQPRRQQVRSHSGLRTPLLIGGTASFILVCAFAVLLFVGRARVPKPMGGAASAPAPPSPAGLTPRSARAPGRLLSLPLVALAGLVAASAFLLQPADGRPSASASTSTADVDLMVYDMFGPPVRSDADKWGPHPWGAHEALPKGVPTGYDWQAGARPGVWDVRKAGATTPWGQVFEAASGNSVADVRVHIRDMELYYLMADGTWRKAGGWDTFGGGYWSPDFRTAMGRCPFATSLREDSLSRSSSGRWPTGGTPAHASPSLLTPWRCTSACRPASSPARTLST